VSEFHLGIKRNISKKSEQLTFTHFKEMALFAAIGDRFIAKILKQVASDYDLDFEEMKTRYCGKSSFELMVPTKQVQVDLEAPEPVVSEPEVESEPEIEVAPKPKKKAATKKKAEKVNEPKEDTSKKLMALSKMKKPELVAECEERDIDSEGTVAQLKERLKEAREIEGVAAPKKKAPAKKAEKAKEPKEPKEKKKAPSKKKAEKAPPPPPEPLEEEVETEAEDEEPDSPGGIRAKMLKEAKNFEEEEPEEEEEEDLQERLRKILAEAEEEEFEDEFDETQILDN